MTGRFKPITAVAVIFFVVAALAPLFVSSWATLFALILAKGIVVLGIVLLLQAGQVSFGHAMFFATGAYTAAFWGKYMGGGDILLYIVLGGISSTIVGLLVGMFVVRYREIFFGMLNLAFSMVLWSLLEKMFHYTNGADGIRVARPGLLGFTFTPETFQYVILYVSLVVAIAAFFGVQRYLESPLGHMLRAIKSNETRLEYLGMSARRVLLIGYVISAFLGGVGGTLVAIIQQIATPEFGFWTKSGEFVFIAILGGGAHAFGAFAGAAMFEIVRFYAAAHLADAWQLILGVVLIVIILYAPPDRAAATRRSFKAGRSLMADILLSAKGIKIRFGGVIAADGIDLDVYEGENLAIIGPNGAGKTTFLNISTGYLRPQAGSVTFLGHDITAHLPRTITKLGIARAFQIPQLFLDQTVMENMLIAAASLKGRPSGLKALSSLPEASEMERLLDLVGVKSYAERKARELPEGQRKLVDIALALALKPRLLLMDEPTSGVASSEKLGIMDILTAALAKEKVTSVFVEHDMDMVERYANRVAVWNMGKIQKVGTPAEVLADPKVREQVIGI